MSDYKTILVPYDFSVHAEAALYAAVDLGRHLDAHLHLLHVIPSAPYVYGGAFAATAVPTQVDMAGMREGVLKSLADVADGIQDFPGRIEPHVVEGGAVADTVGEMAEKLGADLIVMGTHGRTGFAHVFLGSVAERTLRGAPCPVLTVRGPEDGDGQ